MTNPFTSDHHAGLARSVSDLLIEAIRNTPAYGGEEIATRLVRLRDEVWPLVATQKSPHDIRRVFKEALEGLSAVQKTQLLEAYARLGHIHEIAGLAARHHYFSALEKQGKAVPGGVEEFIAFHPDAATAVEQLRQPVFEAVMTAHATNTNSMEFMKAQRELGKAMETGREENICLAMGDFLRAPLLPQKDGNDVNLTVYDETKIVLNYLGNIYDDLPDVYRQFDRSLEKESSYDPCDLKLNMRFSSWGSSGDKDGNNNVTAETTLEAIALHTSAIVNRYAKELRALTSPLLAHQKETLEAVAADLYELLPHIKTLREKSRQLRKENYLAPAAALEKEFDALSEQLATLRHRLHHEALEAALLAAYRQPPDPKQQQAALDLIRRVRTFGFNFAKIEYRETAKEYARVVEKLVPGYALLDPAQRAVKLTALLNESGNKPHALLEQAWGEILHEGAGKAYSKKDALPIAYHTVKRMQLARDFPDMIQDNVLAECGRLKEGTPSTPENIRMQGVANLLEAQFVQRLVGARLGIVPLFEEPATMENIDKIMEEAYRNPAYRRHLESLKSRHDDKPVQQVQIAHSDNARRSGLLAARAYIHEAHKKMRQMNERSGIGTEFFEGGSISDAYRNGVRAVSASVNAFDLHDFAKFTFQGGDLVNYFNLPSSNVRLFTRNLVHGAARFDRDANGRWAILPRPERRSGKRRPNDVMDEIAIAALKETVKDYQKEDFTKDKMGVLLRALDYDAETKAGNVGSRAADRAEDTIAFAPSSRAHAGAFIPVDIEEVRTIPFSEAWQHAGIVPSWIGSQKLEEHLRRFSAEKVTALARRDPSALSESEHYFLERFGGLKTSASAPLAPGQIHDFYEKSPTFRDAQDRAAFALAMTDPESLEWLERRMTWLAKQYPHQDSIASGQHYLDHIKETYRKAGRLAHEALKGSTAEGNVRATLTESLDRLSETIKRKSNYREFLLFAKLQGIKNDGELNAHQRRAIHSAGDTVVHGRFPAADDAAYGEHRAKMHQEQGEKTATSIVN